MTNLSRTARPILLLLLLAAAALRPAAAQEPPPPLEGLDGYIRQAMDAWETPGLAIAVVHDDSVVWAEGFGVRELGSAAEVTPRTLFLIASTTKAFTAASLGMMVDAGTLAWDDPVIEHLPGFRLRDPWVTREITVRDLLTHRVGIDRADRVWWASPHGRDEVVKRVRHLGARSSFRAEYGYNNNMYITAGEVVEAASGETWDAFVRERIFAPLGMTASNTSVRELPEHGDVATPHERIDGEVRPIDWRDVDNLGGAGSINSNVLELAQWARLQLAHGSYAGERLLSDSVFDELHGSQTIVGMGERTKRLYPSSHFRTYGLGWVLHDYRGHKVVQHSGALDGMRARIGLLPEQDLGVVMLANMTASDLLEALLFRVFDGYIGGRTPEDWSAKLLAVRDSMRAERQARRDSIADARVEGTEPSLALARYAGTYRHRAYGKAEAALEDDALVLRVGPHFTGDLEHWHHDTFRARWRDPSMGRAFVTFTLDAAGTVESLTIEDWAEFEREPEEADEGLTEQ